MIRALILLSFFVPMPLFAAISVPAFLKKLAIQTGISKPCQIPLQVDSKLREAVLFGDRVFPGRSGLTQSLIDLAHEVGSGTKGINQALESKYLELARAIQIAGSKEINIGISESDLIFLLTIYRSNLNDQNAELLLTGVNKGFAGKLLDQHAIEKLRLIQETLQNSRAQEKLSRLLDEGSSTEATSSITTKVNVDGENVSYVMDFNGGVQVKERYAEIQRLIKQMIPEKGGNSPIVASSIENQIRDTADKLSNEQVRMIVSFIFFDFKSVPNYELFPIAIKLLRYREQIKGPGHLSDNLFNLFRAAIGEIHNQSLISGKVDDLLLTQKNLENLTEIAAMALKYSLEDPNRFVLVMNEFLHFYRNPEFGKILVSIYKAASITTKDFARAIDIIDSQIFKSSAEKMEAAEALFFADLIEDMNKIDDILNGRYDLLVSKNIFFSSARKNAKVMRMLEINLGDSKYLDYKILEDILLMSQSLGGLPVDIDSLATLVFRVTQNSPFAPKKLEEIKALIQQDVLNATKIFLRSQVLHARQPSGKPIWVNDRQKAYDQFLLPKIGI